MSLLKPIHTVIENQSRYSIDTVWENAQDLEHVAWLHQKTNESFELLHAHRETTSPFVYDLLIYRCVRKTAFLNFQSFGFRKIVGEYNIHQFEILPALGVKSVLNSMLHENSSNSEFPTKMVDEIVMEVPLFLQPLKAYITRSLHRHARIQCQEDEPFRERREELAKRQIHLPFSLFNTSDFERLTEQFTVEPFRSGKTG